MLDVQFPVGHVGEQSPPHHEIGLKKGLNSMDQ